ncbi:hypothetical protein, partial [Thauera sinica]
KQSAGVLLDFDRFGVSFGLSSVVTINVFSLRFQEFIFFLNRAPNNHEFHPNRVLNPSPLRGEIVASSIISP